MGHGNPLTVNDLRDTADPHAQLGVLGDWCGHRNRGYLPRVVTGRLLPDGDGLHPSVIQERLGHATIAETDNYGRLFPDASELGRDALDAMFASADAFADMRPRTIVSVQSQVKQRAAGELACRPGTNRGSSATSRSPPHDLSPAAADMADSQ